jgi:hypothetical protein
MDLNAYIALLQTADDQISAESARLLTEATDDLRAYAQQIGHKQSGAMTDSMHRLGPFPVGSGVLEARVESGAWYAEDEVAKGGTHDWASRTIDEQQARILQLELEAADRAASILTGGGR